MLNPPQKPTVQNKRVVGEISCLWSAKPITKPKAKHAIKFTKIGGIKIKVAIVKEPYVTNSMDSLMLNYL